MAQVSSNLSKIANDSNDADFIFKPIPLLAHHRPPQEKGNGFPQNAVPEKHPSCRQPWSAIVTRCNKVVPGTLVHPTTRHIVGYVSHYIPIKAPLKPDYATKHHSDEVCRLAIFYRALFFPWVFFPLPRGFFSPIILSQ